MPDLNIGAFVLYLSLIRPRLDVAERCSTLLGMVTLRLPAKTERMLERTAKKQGRTKLALVREAVVEKLEDIEDMAASDAVMKRLARGQERTYSAAEVKRAVGL
jgi:RHH-type rel operon transcriptional repressor/antitoxin RelB